MQDEVQTQDEVLAFLGDPRTFGIDKVKRVDTHAASVFLAGDRALKIKRAVRFPFLDYSTLDRRKAACEAEIQVNRPFGSGIYRGVVPIVRLQNGRLALGGDGIPVEWAVEMQRFDEAQTLDHLADKGLIDLALAGALGALVAQAHATAGIVPAQPWIDALETYLRQNDAELRTWPDLFPPGEISALTDATQAKFDNVKPLLAARGASGLIRRGHGDLHLGNIALIDGKPALFDAIEFDPLIASGDVLYDLAFLIMDILERGHSAAANVVLNRYLIDSRRDEHLDGLAALPLFLSIRAAIRAKVTAARLSRAGAADPDHGERAVGYFHLARGLIAPPRPRIVAIGGLSGTGKSLLARMLAPEIGTAPGAVVLRSDVVRKLMHGRTETEKLPDEAYRPDVTQRVYAKLANNAARVAGAGHAAIVDAVFAKPEERAAIAGALPPGVSFVGLFLQADLTTRVARVGARVNDASDADAAIAAGQERYALKAIDWAVVDASGTPDETLGRARQVLHGAR